MKSVVLLALASVTYGVLVDFEGSTMSPNGKPVDAAAVANGLNSRQLVLLNPDGQMIVLQALKRRLETEKTVIDARRKAELVSYLFEVAEFFSSPGHKPPGGYSIGDTRVPNHYGRKRRHIKDIKRVKKGSDTALLEMHIVPKRVADQIRRHNEEEKKRRL